MRKSNAVIFVCPMQCMGQNIKSLAACVCVLLQVGPCGEVRAYIISLWGVRDLSPTYGDPYKYNAKSKRFRLF